jgi:hypothetical protein
MDTHKIGFISLSIIGIAAVLMVVTAPTLTARCCLGGGSGTGVTRTPFKPATAVPMATSGNNLYMAWPNDDTGHWNVFFAKSTDAGKTLKTIMISAPNKGHTVDLNTQISASGANVYVTWWTNKTGTDMPVFRASNDNGNTFGKTMILNSTKR